MSIIDRARDAVRDLDHEDTNARWLAISDIHGYAVPNARAVVRAAKLAGVWDDRADLPGEYSPAEQSAYRVAAQELRAELEGAEE